MVTLSTTRKLTVRFNPLFATLKPQSNGPSYSNTVTGIHWPLMGDGLCYVVRSLLQNIDHVKMLYENLRNLFHCYYFFLILC